MSDPKVAASPTDNRLDKFAELVGNVMLARKEWMSRLMDPRRDYDAECGYPPNHPTAWDFQRFYDRDPVANRVNNVFPRETWQVLPDVYEVEEADKSTPFEDAWNGISNSLREGSWFQDQTGSPIWEYLRRADELSGIGHYGIVLIGIDDGKPLDQPAELPNRSQPAKSSGFVLTNAKNGKGKEKSNSKTKGKGKAPGRKLLYLRCFPETLAQITQFEQDASSARFGQPTQYQITLNDPREGQSAGIGQVVGTYNVHWTRIHHVADNRGSSEIFGAPRMRPVINRLIDLTKLYGGSAEMYWRGAFPGLSFETHPQMGGDVVVDQQKLKDMVEDYSNGLQRFLALIGMTAKTLSPTVVPCDAQIKTQLEAICIQLGIPMRIFLGSERGELASSQDDIAWNDRIKLRQHGYVTPLVIVPFIDRLIQLDVLPIPEGYSIEWPDLTSQSEADKVAIGLQKTQALTQYIGGSGESVVPPLEYLTQFLYFTDEEAEAILKAAEEKVEEDKEKAIEDQLMEQELASMGLGPNGEELPVEEEVPAEEPAPEEVPTEPATNRRHQRHRHQRNGR